MSRAQFSTLLDSDYHAKPRRVVITLTEFEAEIVQLLARKGHEQAAENFPWTSRQAYHRAHRKIVKALERAA